MVRWLADNPINLTRYVTEVQNSGNAWLQVYKITVVEQVEDLNVERTLVQTFYKLGSSLSNLLDGGKVSGFCTTWLRSTITCQDAFGEFINMKNTCTGELKVSESKTERRKQFAPYIKTRSCQGLSN